MSDSRKPENTTTETAKPEPLVWGDSQWGECVWPSRADAAVFDESNFDESVFADENDLVLGSSNDPELGTPLASTREDK